MHSVFVPRHALLARRLHRSGIPYLVTPNSLAPALLKRRWIRKRLYVPLVEQRRLRRAAAIAVITEKEAAVIRGLVPGYRGIVRAIFDPIETRLFEHPGWKGQTSPPRLVYLGRFDVQHKGIDNLVELGRNLSPEIEIHLYGVPDRRTAKRLKDLRKRRPRNVNFHAPVWGDEKLRVLNEAAMCIQLSRWEVFGVSPAEAMALGVPTALADTMDMASIVGESDAVLVVPSDLKRAARAIESVLANSERLHQLSVNGRRFAGANYKSSIVSNQYVELYRDMLEAPQMPR